MSLSQERIDQFRPAFAPNYNPAPFVIDRGEGCWLFDLEGCRYLDFTSGIAVTNLGHCPPGVLRVIQEQSQKLLHSSNLFWNEPSMKLAGKMIEHSFAKRVFFTNSGTESNEAALKICRKFFYDLGQPRPKFLSFLSGFHGRSFGSLSATPKEAFRKAFEPLVPGFEFAKLHDEKALSQIDDQTAAVLIEPIQGEGGVLPCDPEFLKRVKDRCDQTGSLLVLDCIQVGFFRAGEVFGYEHLGFEPDIVSLAKGMGSGLPIGAILIHERLQNTLDVGSHGTTFGGNPLCSAVALFVLEQILKPDLQKQWRENSKHFFHRLHEDLKALRPVKEIRGRGHMIGIEFEQDNSKIFQSLRDRRVLVTRIAPNTLRVLPPLVTTAEDFEVFVKALRESIEAHSE